MCRMCRVSRRCPSLVESRTPCRERLMIISDILLYDDYYNRVCGGWPGRMEYELVCADNWDYILRDRGRTSVLCDGLSLLGQWWWWRQRGGCGVGLHAPPFHILYMLMIRGHSTSRVKTHKWNTRRELFISGTGTGSGLVCGGWKEFNDGGGRKSEQMWWWWITQPSQMAADTKSRFGEVYCLLLKSSLLSNLFTICVCGFYVFITNN